MKRTAILSIICFACIGIFGQTGNLDYQNGVWQEGKKLTPTEVRALMSYNSEALSQYKNGKALKIVGYIVSVPSAFIFGYDIGGRIAGGEGNNTMLIVGAAGTVVGLLVGFAGERKIKQSVQLYNSSLNDVSYQINFGLTQTGVGLTIQF